MKRKHCFTLLEVLIALSLATLIMTVLLSAYLGAVRSTLIWKQQEDALFQEQFLEQRLSEVFATLIEPELAKTFFFTTDSSQGALLPGSVSLVFSYDNGIVLDAALSGPVLGRLFVDREGRLILLTYPERSLWSDTSPPPFHKEVLMKGIQGMEVEFFQAPAGGAIKKEGGWRKGVWPKDLKETPAIIKMTFLKDPKKVSQFFFLVPEAVSKVYFNL